MRFADLRWLLVFFVQACEAQVAVDPSPTSRAAADAEAPAAPACTTGPCIDPEAPKPPDAGAEAQVPMTPPLPAPQTLRTDSIAMAFDEQGSLVTVAVKPKGPPGAEQRVSRGAATPGAPLEVLFTMPEKNVTLAAARANALFTVEYPGILVRRDGSAGGPSVATTLDFHASALVVDGTELVYVGDNDAVFRIAFDGTGKTRLDIGNPGGKSAIAVDASDRYWATISPPTLYRASKAGGAAEKIPVTNVPKYVDWLGTSATHVVGRSATGAGVDCGGWTWTLWSAPKTGGAVKVLASGVGTPGFARVDGDEVFSEDRICASAPGTTRIFRQKVDGTGARTLVADVGRPGPMHGFEIRNGWLYWIDPIGTVQRAAR